jgi:hypothetical protein
MGSLFVAFGMFQRKDSIFTIFLVSMGVLFLLAGLFSFITSKKYAKAG